MEENASREASHSLRGPTDRGALCDFRDVFEEMEPLADGTLDDIIDPSELNIQLDDGIGAAESARLDIDWTTHNDYNIHYTDADGRDLRWDLHPNDFPAASDERHFHPPPNASSDSEDVEESCIERRGIELVARATQKLWRKAYRDESFTGINRAVDPP